LTSIVVGVSPWPVVTIQRSATRRTDLANPIAHRGRFWPSARKAMTSPGVVRMVMVWVSLRMVSAVSSGSTCRRRSLDRSLTLVVTAIFEYRGSTRAERGVQFDRAVGQPAVR